MYGKTRSSSRAMHSFEADASVPFSDVDGHVLPTATTSLNRQPRSRAASLACSLHSASSSRPTSRASPRRDPGASSSSNPNHISPYTSSSLTASYTMNEPAAGPSSSTFSSRLGTSSTTFESSSKRKKTILPKRRIRRKQESESDDDDDDDWHNEVEDEVDQLLSDSDDVSLAIPLSNPSVSQPQAWGFELGPEASQSYTQTESQLSTSTSDPSDSTLIATQVSSPTLAKLLHPNPITPSLKTEISSANAVAGPSKVPSPPPRNTDSSAAATPEPLSEYSCPICFFPPTNASITPCGHICCGQCLFTAVKTTLSRASLTAPLDESNVARCPVCRAAIPGWDGRGGGVIGLKVRAIFSI